MDFSTLHSFVILAEVLSFAKAAKKVHTSQSTLSRRIQSLENELGVQLLQRDTRNIKLTEAGKEFYFQANQLLEQYRLAVGLTKKAVEGYTRKLRIGIGYYEQFFLLPFIGRFTQDHKDVQIDLYQFIYETLLEQFIRGNLDIILTSDQFLSSINEEAYVKQLLWEKDWSLILSKDNPLSAYPYLDRKQLRNQSIITMYNGSADMIRKVYHNQAFLEPFKSIIRVNSFSGKLTLVAANMGIGFIPSFAEVASYKGICIRKLYPSYTPRKFYILCNAHAYDHTISDFFALCRQAAEGIAR